MLSQRSLAMITSVVCEHAYTTQANRTDQYHYLQFLATAVPYGNKNEPTQNGRQADSVNLFSCAKSSSRNTMNDNVLPSVFSPCQLRALLEEMVINDLLGPAAGPDEE